MLLVPALAILGAIFAPPTAAGESKIKIYVQAFPLFALGFIAVSGFNSLDIVPSDIKSAILVFDNFVLTMAMAALGVETNFGKIKEVGIKPFLLAGAIFLILACILLSTQFYL